MPKMGLFRGADNRLEPGGIEEDRRPSSRLELP